MNSGARIAVAVGVGYLVGRRRKLRTALTLTAAVALGRASQNPGGLTKWGGDLLRASPQLSNLGQLGRPLASASRAAATAAASSGIDTLSGKLRGSADTLRRRGAADTDEPEQEDIAGPEGDAPEDEQVAGRDDDAPEGANAVDEEAEQPEAAGAGGKTRRRKR